MLYQIDSSYRNRLSGKLIDIHEKNGELKFTGINGKPLKIKIWQEKVVKGPKVLDAKGLEMLWHSKPKKPGKHHPWR